jgi:hypothetical protein
VVGGQVDDVTDSPELAHLVNATLDYHWAEFAGAVIPGKDPIRVRMNFDDAVHAYRAHIGLTGTDNNE